MIPNTTVNTVEGSLGGTAVAMQIDANSIAHIMSVLTELYSDPALAVVREYSVNARDSHIEAGQTRPIEVETPSALSRFFKVKDYGVGLSVDDLTEMYSKYGASTKRGTDTQTGMLGLGSKSGLAYTNQFTIVSVKNGVKATVSVRRVEDGTGVLEVIDTVSTTDPNGVEIVIPVRNISDFETRCNDFFKYWEPGTVLVNGKQPATIFDTATEILPHIWIRKSTYWSGDKDTIVMGGVPYPIDERINRNYTMVAFVPVGAVNFTPSREELHFTDLTKKAISTLNKELNAAIAKVGQDRVAQAKTRWEAIISYNTFVRDYGVNISPVYKGVALDTSYEVNYIEFRHNATRNQTREYTKTPTLTYLTQVGIVTGFPYRVLSSDRKAKIRKWVQDTWKEHSLSFDNIMLLTAPSELTDWIQPERVIDWAEVDKIDLGKSYAARKTTGPAYRVHEVGGGTVEKGGLTGPILYFSPADMRERGQNTYYIGKHFPNHTVVSVGKNRWDKLVRDYPQAQHIDNYFREEIKTVRAALTDADIRYYHMDAVFKALSTKLDLTKIDDPEFVTLLTFDPNSATLKAWSDLAQRHSNVLGFRPVFPEGKSSAEFSRFKKKYPLLFDRYGAESVNKIHATAYINAIYAMEQENKS